MVSHWHGSHSSHTASVIQRGNSLEENINKGYGEARHSQGNPGEERRGKIKEEITQPRKENRMGVNHIPGNKKGDIMLYALSTCAWCKKTKNLLEELNVAFNYTDVDLLNTEEKESVVLEIIKWNPACSFPSMVVDNKLCIVGFDENKIRDTFK